MNWHKKNIAMLVGLLFMSLQMFGQYKISGHIKNHGGRILLLVQDATGKYDTLANSLTANGKFYFTGKVRRPIAAEIRAVNTRLRIPIFLEKGDYKVSADVNNISIRRSVESTKLSTCSILLKSTPLGIAFHKYS